MKTSAMMVVTAALALAAQVLTAPAVPAAPPTAFADAIFKATHNSYSGGDKKSVTYQLDHGVRFLEYDIHDNGYTGRRDYAIGHDEPGNQVSRQGNPASNNLRDWLTVVASWSARNRTHAPIVVMLDIKDDLTDNASFAEGNMAALNAELLQVFGSKLLQAKDVNGTTLPPVDQLRGRVLALLSGKKQSSELYRRDSGKHPAVAVNARGQVVQVYDAGDTLWYWTGQLAADGRVEWLRHGKYDDGKTPAVALNDDGTIVEVHQSQNHTTLWSRVGKLGTDGEISWSASKKYDDGVNPTVRFTGPNTVHEIHQSQSNSQNWTWDGTVEPSAVAWKDNKKTAATRYPKAESGSLRVWTGTDAGSPPDTLRYSTVNKVNGARICYTQVAFTEHQQGNGAELEAGAIFFAAPAKQDGYIAAQRGKNRVVRGWDFDDPKLRTVPLANQPATNHPWSDWYQELTRGAAE